MPPIQPLIALRDASVTFGGKPLFAGITLSLGRGERVALVGANGAGKSTILKALSGEFELDGGERFLQPGTSLGTLAQNPEAIPGQSVAEALSASAGLGVGDYRVAAMLDLFELDAAPEAAQLSGGEGRRLALAQALIGKPDLMLLDEPTNHLDLPNISRLEELIAGSRGGVLMISHDRAFLARLATRVLWLDRGRLFELNDGFGAFDAWSQDLIRHEAEEQRRLEKRMESEEYWLARGVTARRSRNQGRRRRLVALRQEKARSLAVAPGRAKLQVVEASGGGRLAIEAKEISKSFTGPDGRRIKIVDRFSTRIRRGDRVGLIGPNGAGKTTLIKLLTGEMAPDQGAIRLSLDLRVIRLDQKRESFDLDRNLWETLAPGGGDSIIAQGRERHVVAYLRDFLFDERQAKQPLRTLSGGERARLMLARLFACPGNLIVLDEPTNDLDLDTLDLLEEVLSEFEGTLILVSHDRDFLDRLVTSVIALEGDGTVAEYAGGYSDYLAQRPQRLAKPHARPRLTRAVSSVQARTGAAPAISTRLTFKEKRAFDELPARIEAMSAEIATLEAAIADPTLYARDRAKFERASALLHRRRTELHQSEERWLELAGRA